MFPKFFLVLGVLALHSSLTIAIPQEGAHLFKPRGDPVCAQGIYGELVPILNGWPIAEAFCSAVHPVKCTTAPPKLKRATAAITTATAVANNAKKGTSTTSSSTTAKATTPTTTKARTTTTSTTKTPTTTTTTTKTTSSQDVKSSAWSKCQQQPGNVISTLCSCIETPKVSCHPPNIYMQNCITRSWGQQYQNDGRTDLFYSLVQPRQLRPQNRLRLPQPPPPHHHHRHQLIRSQPHDATLILSTKTCKVRVAVAIVAFAISLHQG